MNRVVVFIHLHVCSILPLVLLFYFHTYLDACFHTVLIKGLPVHTAGDAEVVCLICAFATSDPPGNEDSFLSSLFCIIGALFVLLGDASASSDSLCFTLCTTASST